MPTPATTDGERHGERREGGVWHGGGGGGVGGGGGRDIYGGVQQIC